jgi:hypothetical protein
MTKGHTLIEYILILSYTSLYFSLVWRSIKPILNIPLRIVYYKFFKFVEVGSNLARI